MPWHPGDMDDKNHASSGSGIKDLGDQVLGLQWSRVNTLQRPWSGRMFSAQRRNLACVTSQLVNPGKGMDHSGQLFGRIDHAFTSKYELGYSKIL